jgi:hypothetical protein
MLRRPIHDEVMGLASRLAQECHPQVALQHAQEVARYARLKSAWRAGQSPLNKQCCRRCIFDPCTEVRLTQPIGLKREMQQRVRCSKLGQ